jgi:hypothetical protein
MAANKERLTPFAPRCKPVQDQYGPLNGGIPTRTMGRFRTLWPAAGDKAAGDGDPFSRGREPSFPPRGLTRSDRPERRFGEPCPAQIRDGGQVEPTNGFGGKATTPGYPIIVRMRRGVPRRRRSECILQLCGPAMPNRRYRLTRRFRHSGVSSSIRYAFACGTSPPRGLPGIAGSPRARS